MARKILLHGSGAIGTIYMYLLQKAGYEVAATCRSNYKVAKANGFLLDSQKYGREQRIHPKVFQTPADAASHGPFDYVLVATKAIPESETSEVIAPAVTKSKTCIALLQNGIGIEDEYAEKFPENPLLSCSVYLPATQISPAHVQMRNFERLEVGSFPASAYKERANVKEAADEFMGMMQKAGSKAEWFEDVQEKRWNKLLLNAPLNPICALTLSRDNAFLASDPGAEDLLHGVMLEVVAIAQKLGYTNLTAGSAAEQLKLAGGGRPGSKGVEPSMLVDVLNGRRMEVETILGNPVKIAKKLDIAVPRLEMLYGLTKALNEAVTYRQPGQSLAGDETRAERSKRGEKL